MKTILAINFLFFSLASIAANTRADVRVIDDAAWRTDISTVAEAIRSTHPRPFKAVSQETFEQAYEELLRDVPRLSDKEIIVHLAKLVALINDGHTRLAIPRQHPEIGLEFGHTQTPSPNHSALEFRQLPLAFEKFDDGVFVVSARVELADLIGHQVTEIDGKSIEDALAEVQTITFAENEQLQALMGVDRLSLIEALAALGISRSDEAVSISLIDRSGVSKQITVRALPSGPLEWIGPFATERTPFRLKNPEKVFWAEHVADGNYVYMQLDEITDGEVSLAEFVTTTLGMADSLNAKLIIDIRNNFGGSGGLNKTLIMSIIQNNELNQYGRTFVLTGQRTFSAAQMLVNELEQYTRVSIVGEPTGSRPDHYGDPKKIRLEHSGLTLRVSRLHWSSYTAFDDRDAAYPDFPVYWTSADFFAGDDPALALAVSLTDVRLETLMINALRRADQHQLARYTLDSKRAPDTYMIDFSSMLLEIGGQLKDDNDSDKASLAYRFGLYFYPEHEGLTAALAELGSE